MCCITPYICPWRIDEDDYALQQGGAKFFPNGDSTREAQLVYLAELRKNKAQSPFTLAQEKVLYVSERTDQVASCVLNTGCCVAWTSGIASGGAAIYGFFGTLNPLTSGVALVSTVSSLLSYAGTGTYPHMASNEDNRRQNTFTEIKEDYKELGVYLLELSRRDFDKAAEIAQNLEIDDIVFEMGKSVTIKEAQILAKPLKKARKFILTGKIPSAPTEIYLTAQNILLQRQVEKLSAGLLKSQRKQALDPSNSSLLTEEDSL